MPARFFGQFALEHGAITRDMLLDAMAYQQTINHPLCALAVENGYLNAAQLRELDEEQRKSDEQFVRLALARHMLTFQQLEELAALKSEKWIFLGEALVQRKHLTLEQLHKLFEEYRNERTEHGPTPGLVPANTHEKDVVEALLSATVDIFVHYSRQIIKVVSVDLAPLSPDDISYTFSQRITGDKDLFYLMALPEPLAQAIASHILGQTVTRIDDMALDAVSEFVNIVVGNGCVELSMKNCRVSADPPAIMTRETLMRLLSKDVITARMRTSKGDFSVVFAFVTPAPGHA